MRNKKRHNDAYYFLLRMSNNILTHCIEYAYGYNAIDDERWYVNCILEVADAINWRCAYGFGKDYSEGAGGFTFCAK